MTYKASELEKSFKKVARIRHGKEYERDDGYWTGGKCDWGGEHNLSKDCQTFADAFNKIESLGEIKEELRKCTSKSEYDAKKNNYIRKCDEGLSGLQAQCSVSVSFELMKPLARLSKAKQKLFGKIYKKQKTIWIKKITNGFKN